MSITITRWRQDTWRPFNITISVLVAVAFIVLVGSALRVNPDAGQSIGQVQAQKWSTIPIMPHDDWTALKLPARLCTTKPDPCYDYYRSEFVSLKEQMAVYIPRFVGSIRIILNGSDLGEYGSIEHPLDLHFLPTMTRLPKSLVLPGVNHLDIVITNEPERYHQLNGFYIGSEKILEDTFAFTNYIARNIPSTSIGIYATLGLLSLMVFLLGGRDPLFGWFTMITLFSGMRSFYFVSTQLDPFLVRGGFYFLGSIGGLASIYLFARNLVNEYLNNKRDIIFMVVTILLSLGLTLWDTVDPSSGNWVANAVVRFCAVAVGVAVTWYLIRHFRTSWSIIKLWSAALFVTAFVFVLHDTLPPMFGWYIPVQLSNLSPLLVVMAFCLIAGQRFSDALNRSKAYNDELAAEVDQAKITIENTYQELAAVRERETILTERHRIMREIHDGVGGKLAGVLYMARNAEQSPERSANIAIQIEESLLDLRSIIDTLDSEVAQNFGEALNNFENKIMPWLHEHGLKVHVEVEASAVSRPVSSSWLLSVFRLLQESLSNIVKHARASHVKLRIFADDEWFKAEIADDGVGFDHTQKGRGLGNMKERCEELGGSFAIDGTQNGTILNASIPIRYESS